MNVLLKIVLVLGYPVIVVIGYFLRRADDVELHLGREKYRFKDLRSLRDFVASRIEQDDADG